MCEIEQRWHIDEKCGCVEVSELVIHNCVRDAEVHHRCELGQSDSWTTGGHAAGSDAECTQIGELEYAIHEGVVKVEADERQIFGSIRLQQDGGKAGGQRLDY